MAVVINSETKLTYDDYVLLPEDGKIHEIIDGEHYLILVPETYHQTLSGRIQFRVPGYWLVDPKSQQITVFRLKGDSYQTIGSFHDEVRYQALKGVAVDLSRVW